jgi:hypothetical protein
MFVLKFFTRNIFLCLALMREVLGYNDDSLKLDFVNRHAPLSSQPQ